MTDQGAKILMGLRQLAGKLHRGDHGWPAVDGGIVEVTHNGARVRLLGRRRSVLSIETSWLQLERAVDVERFLDHRVAKAARELEEATRERDD